MVRYWKLWVCLGQSDQPCSLPCAGHQIFYSESTRKTKARQELVGVPFAASNKTPDLQARPPLLFPHQSVVPPRRLSESSCSFRCELSPSRAAAVCPPQHCAVFSVAWYCSISNLLSWTRLFPSPHRQPLHKQDGDMPLQRNCSTYY
jgi:hypothetical protein